LGLDWRFARNGTPRASVDAIRIWWDNLYARMIGAALSKGAVLESTDVAANVMVGWFNDWTSASMRVRLLTSFLSMPERNGVEEALARAARRHRTRILGLNEDIAKYSVPTVFREVVDRYATPAASTLDGPLFFASMRPTAGSDSTTDYTQEASVTTQLNKAETEINSLRNTASRMQIMQLMSFFFPGKTDWPMNAPVLDPGLVTEYLSMGVRADDADVAGTDNLQFPNLAESAVVELWCAEGASLPAWYLSLVGPTQCFETRKEDSNQVSYGLFDCNLIGVVRSTSLNRYTESIAGVVVVPNDGLASSFVNADLTTNFTLMNFLHAARAVSNADADPDSDAMFMANAHAMDIPFESSVLETYAFLGAAFPIS
jgi:hypothetical protein